MRPLSFSVLLIIGMTITFVVLLSYSVQAATYFVDSTVVSSGGGWNWANAKKTIQEAIDAASAGDEIWVKEGTYLQSSQNNVYIPIAIYGGFNGTESSRDQRNWKNYVTIVDGQNSVRCFNITDNVTIDGFTIKRGSWSEGGGIHIDAVAMVTIANSTFTNNLATTNGGAIYNHQCELTIVNCTFSNNSATGNVNGGAIYIWESQGSIQNSTFSNNSTTGLANAGAIYIWESQYSITKCTFSNNTTDYNGGAIYNRWSDSTITDCTFSGNSAKSGGAMFIWNSIPTITNSIFYDNESSSNGGAVYMWHFSPTITNSIFYDNRSSSGGGFYNIDSSPVITNSVLWGNTATVSGPQIENDVTSIPTVTFCDVDGSYPGTGNINTNPQFVDAANGDFHLQADSPCIDAGDNLAPTLPATDFDGANRKIDAPLVQDTGNGTPPIVDIGPYEYHFNSVIPSIILLLLSE